MGINTGKVIVGGLIAGIVINVGEFLLNGVILAEEWAVAMKALNKPPMGESAGEIAILNVMGFVLGFAAVWLYAAMRPRLGAGPKTAVVAGLAVWFLAYAYAAVFPIWLGLFPLKLMVVSVVWGLVEIPLGAAIGAKFYTEEGATMSAAAGR